MKTVSKFTCPTCNGKVIGRSDKIFCSIKCKNKYHYGYNRLKKLELHKITKKIKRNLHVLDGLFGKSANKCEIHRDVLFNYGFDETINTGVELVKGNVILKLSNYTLQKKSNDIFEVYRDEEIPVYLPGFYKRWEVEFSKPGKILNEFVGRFRYSI